MKLTRFIIAYHVFALIIAFSAVALQFFLKDTAILSPHFWLIFVVVFLLTLLAYIFSDFSIKKSGELSVYGIIGGLFIKLVASLILVAVLIVKYPENKFVTAMNFFSIYLLFTVFEVTCLLRNLRDQNQM